MNKNELIASIAGKSGLSKKDSEKALAALLETVTETLVAGEKVQIVGFGTFETKHREARMGRNPSNGQPTEIAAATLPQFKAGKALKDAVNQ